MWDSLFKVAFYGAVGLALAAAVIWYVGSLYSALAGKGEVIIAPFEIVGADGAVDKSKGIALAHMLQVQLHEIEQGIDAAQKQLVGKPPEGQTSGIKEIAQPAPTLSSIPSVFLPPLLQSPPIFVQGVGVPTKLLEPAEIKVSIAGVEVGQVLPWLQRQLVNQRTVVFTVYQKKQGVHVTGALTPMRLNNNSLAFDVRPDGAEDNVPLDRVVERIAYEITRRRLASDPNNRVEALDGQEFQSLVEVLQETARLNLLVERGRILPAAFQGLLQTAAKLADSVDGWYQLDNFTAGIAESAKDLDTALKFYLRAQTALPPGSIFDALRKSIAGKIAALNTEVQTEGAQQTAPAANAPAEQAQRKMQEYANEAAEFFNDFLGLKLKPPVVKFQPDETLKHHPYYDGTNIVAHDEDLQFLPDMIFRHTTWPYLFALAGPQLDQAGDATDIKYSAAEILTMLMHQRHLNQDAASSDWMLGKGYVEWLAGKKLTKPFEGTAWTSFANPAIAHVKDKSTKANERQYVNSGIFDKVFYLVSTKRSTDRAVEIWISALRPLKELRRVDYSSFARLLLEGADRDKAVVRDALLEVGLRVEKSTAVTR
jgi:thermolysin metallopeptidase-like protein